MPHRAAGPAGSGAPTAARLRRPAGAPAVAAALAGVVGLVVLSGCGGSGGPGEPADPAQVDPAQVDAVEVPELGACRVLTPDDVEQASDATPTVPCAEPHTAETYAVGPLPPAFAEAPHDDGRLGAFALRTCGKAFERFLGADESRVMRSTVGWAWFRPSEEAWDDGARWYRCDVVGGTEETTADRFAELPPTARGLLLGRRPPDRWTLCATGPTVAGSTKVPCSEPHDWRAVTTIKLGGPDERYPGDRLVEVRTRDFCSDSVGAWSNYPLDYDFGYTWFGAGEWKAGNRRSICWARTDQ